MEFVNFTHPVSNANSSYVAGSPLNTEQSTLHTAHCTLHSAHCTLHTAPANAPASAPLHF